MGAGAQGNLFWGDVDTVILDEADTMFDAGFGPEVRAVQGPRGWEPNPAPGGHATDTLRSKRALRAGPAEVEAEPGARRARRGHPVAGERPWLLLWAPP